MHSLANSRSLLRTPPRTLRCFASLLRFTNRTGARPPRAVRAMASKAELFATPGYQAERDPATSGFIFQQTMYRIKDPQRSLEFYSKVLGMRLLTKLDFPEMKFTLYFLGYCEPTDIPEDPKQRVAWMFSRPACLELTHNWGTEDEEGFAYHNGNSDPRGYGHIGLAVPDVAAACERFEQLGVEFVKRPDDGKMKGLAFIKDPDGYWIEILNPDNSRQFV